MKSRNADKSGCNESLDCRAQDAVNEADLVGSTEFYVYYKLWGMFQVTKSTHILSE